jgi:ABC-2 type transport system permease protein
VLTAETPIWSFAARTAYSPSPMALVMLAVWTIALGAPRAWGYRCDEGGRFR